MFNKAAGLNVVAYCLLIVSVNGCVDWDISTNSQAAKNTFSQTITYSGSPEISYQVDKNGAAIFIAPIEVPPGSFGVQPELSIKYNSHGSDGVLGWGIIIDGISSIRRCGATEVIDGYVGGVTFTPTDRFCLDNQRLILVGGNENYGKPGSLYHTQQESFTKVIAGETICGAGPCSFSVYNKKGWLLSFGGSANSRAIANRNKAVYVWMLDRITDLHGNTVKIDYTKWNDSSEIYPESISYTSNSSANLAATRFVNFTYTERAKNEVSNRNLAGETYNLTRLLKTIRTEASGKMALEYHFEYETSPTTHRPRMKTLEKCGIGGCQKPIIITWSDTQNTVKSPNSNVSGIIKNNWCPGDSNQVSWMEFNGDGISDMACDSSGTHQVLLSNGKTVSSPNSSPDGKIKTNWCTNGESAWGDFNGDGLSDMLCNDNGIHSALLSDGKIVKSPNSNPNGTIITNWCVAPSKNISCSAGWTNFSGTGRADLVCDCSDGSHSALVSNGNSVKSPNSNPAGILKTNWCVGGESRWGDFNGDGLSDLHCRASNGDLSVLVSHTDGSLTSPNSDPNGVVRTGWCTDAEARFGFTDFNADFLTDYTCQVKGVQSVQLSNGNTLISPNNDPAGVIASNQCENGYTSWSDFNGDGFSDLQCSDKSGTQSVLLSNGTSVWSPNSNPSGIIKSNWCAGGSLTQRTDFNGDSMMDLHCATAAGTQSILVHDPVKSDLITSVENGLGAINTFKYAALTDENVSVYNKGNLKLKYPLSSLQSPIYVVSEAANGNNTGDTYRHTYSYEGAAIDLARRISVGFREITIVEVATGRKTITTYSQEFPKIGFALSTVTRNASGKILEMEERTPIVKSLYTNVNIVLLAGERHTTYDQNGSIGFITEKYYEYDNYGNQTITADLGNIEVESDDVYTCSHYINIEDTWKLGYLSHSRVAKNESACRRFTQNIQEPWSDDYLRWGASDYDAAFNVTDAKIWDDTLSQWIVTRSEFDMVGNAVKMTTPAGGVWETVYDETYTFPIKTISPPNADNFQLTTRSTYDPIFGGILTDIDANGTEIKTKYDALGRIVSVSGPLPDATNGEATLTLKEYEYKNEYVNSKPNGTSTTTRLRIGWDDNNTENWNYDIQFFDGLGRPYKNVQRGTDEKIIIREQLYDTASRPWRSSFPRFQDDEPTDWSITIYDDWDRPLVVTAPDGVKTKYTYTQGGLLTVTTTAEGSSDERITTRLSDTRGNLLMEKMSNDGISRHTYNKLSKPIKSLNPIGAVTTMQYDSMGRTMYAESADTGNGEFIYGTDGRLYKSTDAEGNVTTFEYDLLDRIIHTSTIRHSDHVAGDSDRQEESYIYDEASYSFGIGLLTSVNEDSGDIIHHYAHSRYGMKTSTSLTFEGSTYIKSSSYNAQGQIIHEIFPDESRYTNSYYLNGDLEKVAFQDFSGVEEKDMVVYEDYTPVGQVKHAVYGNGVKANRTYYPVNENLSRPKTWDIVDASNKSLTSITYDWNDVGQVSSFAERRNGGTAMIQNYSYLSTGWLKTADGPYGTKEYGYDLAGNITLNDGVIYTMATNSDRIAATNNGTSIQYTNSGRISYISDSSDSWTYQYGLDNRLKTIKQGMTEVLNAVYAYDGTRLKTIDRNGRVTLTPFADYEVVLVGTGSIVTRYITGLTGAIATVSVNSDSKSGGSSAAAVLGRGPFSGVTLTGITGAALGFSSSAINVDRQTFGFMIMGVLLLLALCFGINLAVHLYRAVILTHIHKFRFHKAWIEASRLAPISWCPGFAREITYFSRKSPVYSAMVTPLIIIFLLGSIPGLAQAELGTGGGYPVPGILYLHQDIIEDTILTTDSNGNTSTSVSYLPYGKVDQEGSSGPDNFRPKFSGKEHDFSTQTYYFGSRYYHPGFGRFLEPDPAGQYPSPYTYAGNDPASMIDPNGEIAFAVAVIIAATVIGAAAGAYAASSAVNHSANPVDWDWKSGKTWGAIVAGAAIGGASGALGAAATMANPVAGFALTVALAAGENAAYTAIGGGNAKDILFSAAVGGATSIVFMGGGAAVASGGRRLFGRLAQETAMEGGESISRRTLQAGIGCSSFPEGTPVLTEDGLVNIEDLQVEMEVFGKESLDNEAEPYPVISLIGRTVYSLITLDLDGTSLATTEEHEFWVDGKGWIHAKDLKSGDRLLSADEELIPVLSVSRSKVTPTSVRNFGVGVADTYYVSEKKVLAHNTKGSCLLAKGIKRPSWVGGTKKMRNSLFQKQRVKGGIRSAASGKIYKENYRVKIGKKNPRWRSGWDIDHRVNYKYLLQAAEDAKQVVTWKAMRIISSDQSNLRLMTMSENVSHNYELPASQGKSAARVIFKSHGYTF